MPTASKPRLRSKRRARGDDADSASSEEQLESGEALAGYEAGDELPEDAAAGAAAGAALAAASLQSQSVKERRLRFAKSLLSACARAAAGVEFVLTTRRAPGALAGPPGASREVLVLQQPQLLCLSRNSGGTASAALRLKDHQLAGLNWLLAVRFSGAGGAILAVSRCSAGGR